MNWSPEAALQSQAELLLQARTTELLAARDRAMKECEADAAKRNMLRSGSLIAALIGSWNGLLREHVEALVSDLVDLVSRFSELTPESAEWIGSRISEHVRNLTDGTTRGLAGYVERRNIGPAAVKEHTEREIARAGQAASNAAALRVRMALGEAELARQRPRADRSRAEAEKEPVGLSLDGLHPRVQAVAGALFSDGHFRQAILDAYIALADDVRRAAGLDGIDNTPLMQKAFSAKDPILVVGDDADEQLGFMWLYSGAVMAIRNPKAHRLVEQKDPQRALEWLAFASVLFRVLDDARKPED